MRVCLFLFLAVAASARAQWPFPVKDGSVWRYALTREQEPGGAALTVARLAHFDGKELRLETTTDAGSSMEFLSEKNRSVVVTEVIDAYGKQTSFDPPMVYWPAAPAVGTAWNFQGEITGLTVTLPQKIVAEEEVVVPAGSFRAFRVHGEKVGTFSSRSDRWFAPGVGWIKEELTQRSPTGELITHNVLELVALPSGANASAAGSPARKFEASVSSSTAGAPLTVLSSDALQIVARWRASGLAPKTKVRALWIAEEVSGVAPPDYTVDEAVTTVDSVDAVGTFTLSRSESGFTPGKYRVEFYVDSTLAATLHITIAPRARPVDE